MIQTEALHTILTIDGSQQQAGLEKASREIENYGGKAEKAGTKAADLGKAVQQGLTTQLANAGKAGQVAADAVGALSGRLALAGGIAGVAALGIYKVVTYMDKAGAAAEELKSQILELGRIPASGGAFRQIGEISEHLEKTKTKLSELKGSENSIPSISELAGAASQGKSYQAVRGENIAEATKNVKKDAADLAESYDIAAKFSDQMVKGSEREIDLAKAKSAHLKEDAEISAKMTDPATYKERDAALNSSGRIFENQLKAINHKYDLTESQLALEEEINKIHARRLVPEKEALELLKAQGAAAVQASGIAMTDEERRKATARVNKIGLAQNDLEFEQWKAHGRRFPENDPGAVRAEQRRKRERDLFDTVKGDRDRHGRDPHGRGLFSGGLTTGKVIGASLSDGLDDNGWHDQFDQKNPPPTAYTGKTDFRDLVLEMRQVKNAMEKAWGK